jgi:hypothetical protein
MDSLNQVLNNKYFVGFVTVGTVLYASLAQPALPQGIAKLFEYPLTKMIFYALIVLLLTQNLQVALVVAIAFYILMSMLREQRIAEGFIDGLRTEGFFNQRMDEMESFYAQQEASDNEQQKHGQNPDHEGVLGKCIEQCLDQNKGHRTENRQEFVKKLEQCLKQQHGIQGKMPTQQSQTSS